MIKYKVTFELSDEAIGLMSYVNKKKWIETQKQLIKADIYEMELEYQCIVLMKVTDFKIEVVEENG